MKSILQDWVMNLGLRHQGVLVSAIRGCDTVARDDPVKFLARYLRGYILNPHCGDIAKAASYMQQPTEFVLYEAIEKFAKSYDHYPLHYVMHLIHAAEILGYYHPDPKVLYAWNRFYVLMCNKFHMIAETKAWLDGRLNADEQSFKEAQ